MHFLVISPEPATFVRPQLEFIRSVFTNQFTFQSKVIIDFFVKIRESTGNYNLLFLFCLIKINADSRLFRLSDSDIP